MTKGPTRVGDIISVLTLPDTPSDAETQATAVIKRMQKIAESDAKVKQDPIPSAELADLDETYCQLDLWPEPERGSPNPFLRSALFAAIQSENRQQIQGPPPVKKTEQPPPRAVVSQKGFTIAYKGQQLDQYDFDVWLQAIHYAKSQPVETECVFHGHAFLKEIGRTGGKLNYTVLDESLTRLVQGFVVIDHGHMHFEGHLISYFLRDNHTRVYKVSFADEIVKLFGYSTFTRLQWKERRALKGKALPLWLHGFYSSHAQPFPLTVEYLHKLCGSRNAAMKSFRAALKRAFKELEKVTGMTATFEGNTVTVERQPSGSQAKHLEQRAARNGS
jgi:hypothetical protein